MKKVEIKIPGDNTAWGTLKTKYPADSEFVGQNELTGESKNFDTNKKGIITKRKDEVLYNPTDFTYAPKDQYEAIFVDGVRHLLVVANGTLKYSSGGGTFSDVTTGYSANGNFEFTIYDDRVYFGNGINPDQVYDRATSYGGVAYTAPKTKAMGAQAPSSAPTAGAGTAGGSVPDGGHTYKVTFLYYDLEESNGGTASNLVTITAPNSTVPLTSIPIGGYGVTARKIYRDNNDGNWLLVGTISDNTTTTYNDTASTGTAAIPTTNDTPPQFKYIITHQDRNWIGGITGDSSLLRFSDAGLPNIFPPENYILCNPKDPITGLVIFNDRIIVFNRNSIGQIAGTTKDTFRYSEIPSAIGCVDNRSIQIRTVVGVPTLNWLSDKGFYEYNGSSVSYISDPIEDLVNLNIQQSQQIKGQNAQTTESQFSAGTPSTSILTTGGVVTAPNPKQVWDETSEWEGGSTTTNIATKQTVNLMKAPIRFNPSYTTGTLSGSAIRSGSNLTLPTTTDWTGESRSSQGSYSVSLSGGIHKYMQSAVVPRAGTTVSITFPGGSTSPLTIANPFTQYFYGWKAQPVILYKVWADNGGVPGTELYSGTLATGPTPSDGTSMNGYSFSWSAQVKTVSIPLGISGKFWWGLQEQEATYYYSALPLRNELDISVLVASFTYNSTQYAGGATYQAQRGATQLSEFTSLSSAFSGGYTFVATPLTTTGYWTSAVYDTYSAYISSGLTITASGTYPTSTSSIVRVAGSNNGTTFDVTEDFANINGTQAVSLSARRYWRIQVFLTSTDNRNAPSVGGPTLKFNTQATWISQTIDTKEPTAYNSLTMVSSVPSGTSAALEIATSPDDITYTAFGSLGAAVVQRYAKIRITLNTDAANSLTPTITSATFTWTTQGTLVSSNIDTGTTPAGWDIFQADYATNGGTLAFHMRSASSIGGLAGATWYAVTNGAFPTTNVDRYVNWRITLTATADAVPTVDSVVVNWFISNVTPIRVASLFYERNYYLAAAEYNETANNLMLVYDDQEKWRVYRGISANTLSFFFNDPYYGSSVSGEIYRFLFGNTSVIETVVETKEFDVGYPDKTKIVRNLRINGKNTGAVIYPTFSVDGGSTWIDMINPVTGLTYYATTSDESGFSAKFVPSYDENQTTAGTGIKFRLTESTAAEFELDSLKAELWIRAGEREG